MRILVVDDNRVNREVVRAMLQAGGISVIEANSAVEGLAVLCSTAVDAVLMGLRMPGMDGLEAIRAIRSQEGRDHHTPIAIITADPAGDLSDLCNDAGADELIRKPLNMGDLHTQLGRMLASQQGVTILH